MLRKASQALFANEQFTLEEMHNYRMAVTEREVINGCISQNNVKDHVSKPGVISRMRKIDETKIR